MDYERGKWNGNMTPENTTEYITEYKKRLKSVNYRMLFKLKRELRNKVDSDELSKAKYEAISSELYSRLWLSE